jgi:bifunctional non-homologous end joining protein LigD
VTGSVAADTAGYARWVTAKLVGSDVEYRKYRGTLRHPSRKGLRPDVSDIAKVGRGP